METKIQQGNISINDHKNITSFIADKLGLDTFQNMKPVDQELRKDSSGANLEVQARNAIKLNLENRRNSMSFSNRIQIDKQGHPIEKVHANKTEQADNTSKRRRFSSMKEVFKKFQDKVKSRKNTNSGRTI